MKNWLKHIWRYWTSPMYKFNYEMSQRQGYLDNVKELMLRQQHYRIAKMLHPNFPSMETVEKFEKEAGIKLL